MRLKKCMIIASGIAILSISTSFSSFATELIGFEAPSGTTTSVEVLESLGDDDGVGEQAAAEEAVKSIKDTQEAKTAQTAQDTAASNTESVGPVATQTASDDSTSGPGAVKKGKEVSASSTDVGDSREKLKAFALSLVGNRYVYGGTNPSTGFDCSGFTKYVYKHALGIDLLRSSAMQATMGREVSLSELEVGDLLIYARSGRINHVSMYIGDGRIVHAATSKTGVITDRLEYRTPIKAIRIVE